MTETDTTSLLTKLEAAPVLVTIDEDGDYVVRPVTDDAVLAAAQAIVDENHWNDDERDGLYVAVLDTLDRLPEWGDD